MQSIPKGYSFSQCYIDPGLDFVGICAKVNFCLFTKVSQIIGVPILEDDSNFR